jgi:hypothetical protein
MADLSRKKCIMENRTTCKLVVSENAKADASEPLREIAAFSQVNMYSALIDRVAGETGVDARLIRAIMYMETTHGYYDAPLALIGQNKSLLPMNVNVEYWGNTFGDRKTLSQPYDNIKAGAEILKRIIANLPRPASIRQIATLYQNINGNAVSDYGARVDRLYATQPWIQSGPK